MEDLEFPCLVFVYGSLKRNRYNHSVMENAGGQYIGDTQISGAMYSMGNYPAVALEEPGTVHGEVFEIPDRGGLMALDRLEGYPTFYTRSTVDTELGDAWVYHIPSEKLTEWDRMKVDGGRW